MVETIVAYVVSGAVGVVLDYRQPIYNRPTYVRRGGALGIVGGILLWLPMVLMALFVYKTMQRKDAFILASFVVLSALAYMLG